MTVHTDVRRGQIWRANDPRRLQQVRITAVSAVLQRVATINVVTGKMSTLRRDAFATGQKGFMLVTDVPVGQQQRVAA